MGTISVKETAQILDLTPRAVITGSARGSYRGSGSMVPISKLSELERFLAEFKFKEGDAVLQQRLEEAKKPFWKKWFSES